MTTCPPPNFTILANQNTKCGDGIGCAFNHFTSKGNGFVIRRNIGDIVHTLVLHQINPGARFRLRFLALAVQILAAHAEGYL